MADQEIGKVVHYYDKAMVAVVKLLKGVKAGDPLKFVKGETTNLSSRRIRCSSTMSRSAREKPGKRLPSKCPARPKKAPSFSGSNKYKVNLESALLGYCKI